MNIAEILKYCPKGTKLYSTIFGNVKLQKILDEGLIEVTLSCGAIERFFKDGLYTDDGECVLFPSKDQRDWSKFRLPVKKGDIMMSSITKRAFIASGETISGYPVYICGINAFDNFQIVYNQNDTIWTSDFYIPASEEIKEELFDKMAEAGYKWNADTLELEKIEPKFKEGDIVVDEDDNTLFLFTGVVKNNKIQVCCLFTNSTFINCGITMCPSPISSLKLASVIDRNNMYSILIRKGYKYDRQQHKLVKQEFKPFDKVLARDDNTESWKADIYLEYLNDTYLNYKCASSNYRICIPYEGNEYLLGTTDSL